METWIAEEEPEMETWCLPPVNDQADVGAMHPADLEMNIGPASGFTRGRRK